MHHPETKFNHENLHERGKKKVMKTHRRVKHSAAQSTRFVIQKILLVGRHIEDVVESATAKDGLIARDLRIGYRSPWIYLRGSYRGDVRAS